MSQKWLPESLSEDKCINIKHVHAVFALQLKLHKTKKQEKNTYNLQLARFSFSSLAYKVSQHLGELP